MSLSALQLQETSIESDQFFRSEFIPEIVVVKQEVTDFLKLECQTDEQDVFYSGGDDSYSSDNTTRQVESREKTDGKTSFHPRITPGSPLKPCHEIWYSCSFCDKSLKPRQNMIRHMMLLHDPATKPFGCKFCVLRFDDEKKKDIHESTSHEGEKPKILFCEICGASGDYEKGMWQHKNDDHPGIVSKDLRKRYQVAGNHIERVKVEWNAESAGEQSSSSEVSERRPSKRSGRTSFHPRIASGSVLKPCQEIWYSCNFCDKKLKPRANMVRHMMLLHDPATKPYGCKLCVLRFDKKKKRDYHQATHAGEVTTPVIVCDVCGVSGNRDEGMQQHKADDHKSVYKKKRSYFESSEEDEGENDNECNSRESSDKSSDSELQRSRRQKKPRGKSIFHPRIAAGSVLKPVAEVWYTCNFCKKKLKPRNNMIRHMMLLHDPVSKPFACKFCVLRFDDEKKKDLHEQTTHENEGALILFCKVCGVSGNIEEGMKHHMLDDHKILPSEIENVSFESPSTRIIGNSRSFKQEEHSNDFEGSTFGNCSGNDSRKSEKTGRRKSSTVFHPRITPGSVLKPCQEIWYSCSFCDKSLKPRPNMLRHMMLLHDPVTKPFACKFCVLRFDDLRKKNYHESTVHEVDEDSTIIFSCDICGASGSHEKGMRHHKKEDHDPAKQGRKRMKTSIGVKTEDESTEDESGTMENHKLDDHNRRHESKDTIHATFHPRPAPGSENLEFSEVPFECNFCDKVLKPKNFLVQHMRAKHDPGIKPFACRYCVDRFRTKTALIEHIAESHDKTDSKVIYFCDICGVSGTKKEGMEHHMTDDHLSITQKVEHEFKYNCMRCKAKFKRKQFLDNHLMFHHEENIKCTKCEETFSDKKRRNHHILFHHDKLIRAIEAHEVQREIKCCACSQEFLSEVALTCHLATHRQGYVSTPCQLQCILQMKTYDSFVAHSSYHSNPKTHQCTKCLKIFPLDKKLYAHVAGHKRNEQPRNVKCEKCGSGFRSFKELDIHEKVKHQHQTLFICPFCAKSLASATILDTHIRFVHNRAKEEKFECKVCNRKFMRNTCLIRHSATHRTERPHVCEQCGASFKTKEGIAIHLKRHDGTFLKKFDCTQCSHKFTSRHRLQVHLLTHSGVVSCLLFDTIQSLPFYFLETLRVHVLRSRLHKQGRSHKTFAEGSRWRRRISVREMSTSFSKSR